MKDNVHYWLRSKKTQNFGDSITQILLDELFYPLGVPATNIHITGSVISDLFVPDLGGDSADRPPGKPVVFWGCGVRGPNSLADGRRPNATILSVRGPLSASELRLGDTVPQGDAVFLLPALHTVRPVPEFLHRTVCIPHFHDSRSDQILKELSGCDLVLRPNITNDPGEIRRFIDAIGSAEFVLSAAMNGALAAAAYGRPFAFWDNGHIDLPFKWNDAAALLGIPSDFCARIETARDHYESAIRPVLQVPSLWPSLAVAPLLIRPTGLLKVLRHELSSRMPPDALAEIERHIELFAQCGSQTDRIIENIERKWEELRADGARDIESARQEAQLAWQQAAAAVQERDAARGDLAAARQEAQLARQQAESAVQERDVARGDAAAAQHETQLLRQEVQTAAEGREARDRVRSDLLRAQYEVSRLRTNLAKTEERLRALETSTLWRMTGPLRWLAHRTPGLRTFARRSMKALRWTLTLQFGRFRPSQRSAEAAGRRAVPNIASPARGRLGGGGDRDRPVVLMIDGAYPRPDQDSGSMDAVNFIRMFQSFGYHVVFIARTEYSLDIPARDVVAAMGVECISSRDYASVEEYLQAAASELDVCFLSRVHCGGLYVEAVRRLCRHAKIVFNTVDLHYLREEREALLKQDRRALNVANATRERELAIARLADATIVVSQKEAELVREAVPGATVFTIPLARDCPGRVNDYGARHDIGFIGGFQHPPNVDAVHYFLDAIWPSVRARLPEAEFHVMGADMPDEIANRTDPGFVAVGYVPDLTKQLEAIRLMVAPLRFGAGVKGKVVSSLAHGVPCVATPLGAEGMGLVDGRTIAIADTPETFCQQIVSIYTDEQLWTERSDNGIEFIAERYSFADGRRLLGELLSDIKAPISTELRTMGDPTASAKDPAITQDVQ